MAKPILYSFFMSSASFRVRIALAYKGIDYEYRPVHIFKDEQYNDEFKKLNPMSQVPTLLIDGATLTESLPIIEYLDETRPKNRLLPTDPLQRLQVRRLAEMINAGIQPLQNVIVVKRVEELAGNPEAKKEWGSFFIERGLRGLEAQLQHTAGKYCVGDSLTVPDLCLAPQIYSTKARFSVDLTQFPIISRVSAALEDHEAVQKAHPDAQPDAPNKLYP